MSQVSGKETWCVRTDISDNTKVVRRLIYFLRITPFDSSWLNLLLLSNAIPPCFSSYFSIYSSLSISSLICHSVRPALYFFPLSCPQTSCRFLRHRPRSMNICIIYFVSDSSRSSWQPAIFDAARSIDLTASAKTRRELDSLHCRHSTSTFDTKCDSLNLDVHIFCLNTYPTDTGNKLDSVHMYFYVFICLNHATLRDLQNFYIILSI